MSIILDALKKADSERHLGELPGLHTQVASQGTSATATVPTRESIGWFAATGAGIILLGVLAWQARGLISPTPARLTSVPPAAEPQRNGTVAAKPPEATKGIPKIRSSAQILGSSASGPDTLAAPAPVVTATELPVPPAAPKTMIAPRASHNARSAVRDSPPAAAPASAMHAEPPKALASTVTPAPAPYVMRMGELPPAIQRELPPLSVSGTMYSSNPGDRMLLLDKRMLHEGDEIAPGLVLESVLPKGATLRYKGYLFRIAR